MMRGGRRGQWIILSGIILALGLVSLTTLLNESVSAGHEVAQSETAFAAHHITEIYEETVRTSKIARAKVAKEDEFNEIMRNFSREISEIYALRGLFVNVDVSVCDENTADLTIQICDERMNFTLGPERKIPLK